MECKQEEVGVRGLRPGRGMMLGWNSESCRGLGLDCAGVAGCWRVEGGSGLGSAVFAQHDGVGGFPRLLAHFCN